MRVCGRDGLSGRNRKCGADRSTTERRLAASGIELGATAGMLLKDLAGSEASAIALGKALEIADDAFRAQIVRIPQWTAAKRRKAESEDRADVAVARIPHDAFAQRAGRFVDQSEHQTVEDLRRSRPTVRMDAEEAVDGLVDAPLLAASIDVKPASGLAAQTAILHENGDAGAGGRNYALAVRRLHHAGDLNRDVQPYFIEQGNRAYWESEAYGHRIDVLDRCALGEQVPDFVGVGRENAVYPETGTVLHDDHGLAHAPAECDRR